MSCGKNTETAVHILYCTEVNILRSEAQFIITDKWG